MVLTHKTNKYDREFTIISPHAVMTEDIVSVDDICKNIKDTWDHFPEELTKKKILTCSYYGDLGDTLIICFIKNKYCVFNNVEYFVNNEEFEVPKGLDTTLPMTIDTGIKVDKYGFSSPAKGFGKLVAGYVSWIFKEQYKISFINRNTWTYSLSSRQEYLLNSWAHVREKLFPEIVKRELNLHGEEIAKMEKMYVPSTGIAETVFGEILRACQRVLYRFFNDGDCCNDIYDGNMISYLNVPFMIESNVISDSGEAEKFLKEYVELNKDDFMDNARIDELEEIFCAAECGESCAINCIRVARALIETKKAFPEFLSEKNTKDSRRWLS